MPRQSAICGGTSQKIRRYGCCRVDGAAGNYGEALLFFERLDADRRADKIANILAPGTPGRWLDIGCLHWLLGDRAKAMQMMHGLAAGILDGSIQYCDLGGGMSQGFLLYYMAVTEKNPAEMSFALDYLRNRVKEKKTSSSSTT